MAYTVAIRNNETGEIRIRHCEYEWEDGSKWFWTEGNYGCDCNRFLEFERAAGSDPDFDDCECGDNKFSVLYADVEGVGRVIIDENPTSAT